MSCVSPLFQQGNKGEGEGGTTTKKRRVIIVNMKQLLSQVLFIEHFSRLCEIKEPLGHFSLCQIKEPLEFCCCCCLNFVVVYDDVK